MQYGKKASKSRNYFMIRLRIISALFLIAAFGLFVRELIIFSQQEDQIPVNVTAGGINIGGMSKAQALRALEQAYAVPILIYYEDSPFYLDPASVGFRINWETMLAEALSSGQGEGSFWIRFFNYLTQQGLEDIVDIPLYAEYQRGLLDDFLRNRVIPAYDRSSGSPGYDTQTLTTFSGEGGITLDVNRATIMVDAALRSPTQRTVVLPLSGANSDRPDITTLRDLIIAYLDSQGFIYDGQTTIASVFIMDLVTGEEINILSDVAFSAASTMKVGILIDYFRELSREPTQDESWLMANSLLCSRNSSSNLLMEILGDQNIFSGIAHVTDMLQYVGAYNTYISAPFVEGVSGQQLGSIQSPATSPNPNYFTGADPFNQTTAEDLGILFSLIYDCANYGSGLMTVYPNDEFTQTECRRMLELMSANNLERLLQGGIPEGVRISHKNGWLTDMVGDAGIVYPPNGHNYIISVFIWEEAEFQDFEKLWPLLEGISRAAWNYFSEEDPLINPRELPFSAQDCEGNYLPPQGLVNLDDIDSWKTP